MLAACAVLVSHAYPIALGAGTPEPLGAATGHSLGGLAVLMFFAISGFLITASVERSSSHIRFLRARALRLFPGLVVSLILVAYGLGPLVTQLPIAAYLGQVDPLLFVLRNSALLSLEYTLPGVFDDNPYPTVVGSIWTLKHEVLCYVGVFIAAVAGWLRPRRRAALGLLVYLLIWALIQQDVVPVPYLIERLFGLSLAFAVGVAFWLWRDRLVLTLWVLVGLVGLAVMLRPVGGPSYELALVLAMTYATFWLAYVPRGLLLYNRVGDYSYGVYIYAFPLQGWAVWAFGTQTPLQNMLYALPPTLVCAVLSWHLVERPALQWKSASLWRRIGPGRQARRGP